MSSLHALSSRTAWCLLNRIPGIGPVAIGKLLSQITSVHEILQLIKDGYPGIPSKSSQFLQDPPWSSLEQEENWLAASSHRHLICLADKDYPSLLKQIPGGPPVLYVWGDKTHLQGRQLAIVGSRNPSHQGREQARGFAKALAKAGWYITSGLAMGVDTVAHEGCLAAKVPTLAVLGTGLDRVYPNKNIELAERIRQAGALVSEFPIGTVAKPYHFPRRNRIISGLSYGTLVVEASIKSGSLITARYAAEQGREVFALPGALNNPLAKGCHELIRQGAKLVDSLDHILEEFPKQASLTLSSNVGGEPSCINNEEYTNILKYLGYEPTPVDLIIERSGLSTEEVSSQLLVLELQGSIQTMPGGLYVRVK